MADPTHIPVLLNESIDHLNLRAGSKVIDCTLGLGGHSEAILKKIGKTGRLMAFEQDERNLKIAKSKLETLNSKIGAHMEFVHDNFENLTTYVGRRKFGVPDAILFDLGFSSPHVDDPRRGFSFQKDGPLDMRYDKRETVTAEEVINSFKEQELADIIYRYGEDPKSRIIARAIVVARKKKRITTTVELANIIKATIHGKPKLNPATLTFQALRIYVNRELEVLESALEQAIELLSPGGRLVIISYHSLEDRIVKTKLRYYTKNCICPSELPICQCNFEKKLYLLTKKPIIPSGIEVSHNPRSRSAKLRVAEKL